MAGTESYSFFKVLIDEDKTSQAKRQRKDRIISSVESSRQKPSGGVPKWACISDPSQSKDCTCIIITADRL